MADTNFDSISEGQAVKNAAFRAANVYGQPTKEGYTRAQDAFDLAARLNKSLSAATVAFESTQGQLIEEMGVDKFNKVVTDIQQLVDKIEHRYKVTKLAPNKYLHIPTGALFGEAIDMYLRETSSEITHDQAGKLFVMSCASQRIKEEIQIEQNRISSPK